MHRPTGHTVRRQRHSCATGTPPGSASTLLLRMHAALHVGTPYTSSIHTGRIDRLSGLGARAWLAGCRAVKTNMTPHHAAFASSSVREPTSTVRSLGVWWVRRDMRLDDNEALTNAVQHSDTTLPVHVIDPRDILPRRARCEGGLGVPKLGPTRAK